MSYINCEACGKLLPVPSDYRFCDECKAKVKYGCPCSLYGCCENPDTYTPDHTCIENVCEECYITKCSNCGEECCCDL